MAAAVAELIKGGKTEFNLSNARVLGRENYYSGAKAYRDFQYHPAAIEEAMDEALDWFKHTKSIDSLCHVDKDLASLRAKVAQTKRRIVG